MEFLSTLIGSCGQSRSWKGLVAVALEGSVVKAAEESLVIGQP
jgi:hypothetical protein